MFKSKIAGTVCFITMILIVLFLTNPIHAAHPYKTETFKLDAEAMEPTTINPGDGTSCSNDFTVKNTSNKTSEIQIVLGGMPFSREEISANDIKMFNLRKNLALAKLNGKLVGMDDWAFIINGVNNKTPLLVYCSR